MLTKKCAVDCPKIYERRRAFERSDESQNHHGTANWRSLSFSDSDIDRSDATDYKSLPRRNSTSSRGSLSSRGNIADVESPSRTPEGTLNGSSACLSGQDYSSHRTQTEGHYDDQSAESRQGQSLGFSDDPQSSSRSAMTDHPTYNKSSAETHRGRSSYAGGRRERSCFNDECLPPRSNLLFQGSHVSDSERTYTDSEMQSRLSDSESMFCPELCEHDILRIPDPKITCDSSCPKQARMGKLREKRQAQMDRYILNKGLNYFEDLCHCSLKCLMTQICMDPFIKKTVVSATFFCLGMKLCFELDSWYIPF